jgi:predicted metal-dependent peptidase
MNKKIINARLEIVSRFPFLGFVLQHYDIIMNEDINTAATDGRMIYFSNKFLEGLSHEETIFVLLHELLHIILLHPLRKGNRNLKKFNVACDIVINDILISYGLSSGRLPIIKGEQFEINGVKHTAEDIYNMLPIEIEYLSFDDHTLWEKFTEDSIKNHLDYVLKKAANKNLKDIFSRRLNIDNHQYNPKVNWRKVLQKYLKLIKSDYNFERLDKRFRDVLIPDISTQDTILSDIWICIDVSGSMIDSMIEQVFKETIHMINSVQHIDTKVSFFSTEVTQPRRVRHVKDMIALKDKIETTGGTSFQVIFESIDKMFKTSKPKLIIIMTDGFAEIKPSFQPEMPVLWILSEDGEMPFGECVYINKEDYER